MDVTEFFEGEAPGAGPEESQHAVPPGHIQAPEFPVTAWDEHGEPLLRHCPRHQVDMRVPSEVIAVQQRQRELLRVMGHRMQGQNWSEGFEPYDQWDLLDDRNVEVCERGTHMQCVCTNHIRRFHKVMHKQTGMCIAVGTTCIQRYFGETMATKAHQQVRNSGKSSCLGPGCTAKLDLRTTYGKAGVCSEACLRSHARTQWPLCTVCRQPADPEDSTAGTCSEACLATIWRRCRDCPELIPPQPAWKYRCVSCWCYHKEQAAADSSGSGSSGEGSPAAKRAKRACKGCSQALPPGPDWLVRCHSCHVRFKSEGDGLKRTDCFRCKQPGHWSRDCPQRR